MERITDNDQLIHELFGSHKGNEPVIVLLTQDYIIQQINTSGVNEFHGSCIEVFIGKSFIELLEQQQIPTDLLVSTLKERTTKSYHYIVLTSRHLEKKYSVVVIPGTKGNQLDITIVMSKLDDREHALDTYINSIINNLPGAVYWKDRQGRYMGCNKHVATMAGYARPEEMIGKTDYDMCWNEFADDWRVFDNDVMDQGMTIEREEKAKLASGKVITELTFKTPLKNQEGDIVGIIGTSLDITERKEMEAALRESQIAASAASQAKTEFLENMRHDIRTPLTGIVGFSEILKTESKEEHIKEYADNLIASSHALLSLMDEVLEAVRVSSGDIPILKQKFNLIAIFEQVIDLYRAKALEKHLNLSLSIEDDLPTFVIGDKIRIYRIALELIGNALNFTDMGQIKINVALAKKENRHLVIKIMVCDSGMGIPKDKQQEIYLQFKRLTPSYQGIYKGAGLGLFVVKQFIDELDGEIYVESELRKGTTFTCLIPLQEPLLDDDSGVDHSELPISLKPQPSQTVYTSQIKTNSDVACISSVLVVEDNFIAQKVAIAILSAMNCHIDVASNGEEALNLYSKHQYDLIFMDIGLGEGMDGYEVTHQIRSNNKLKHIPIIALTAHAGDDSKQRCIEAGMDAVLTKPLTQTQAKDILRSFIPERRETAQDETKRIQRDLPDCDDEMFQLDQFALLDSDEALKNCGTIKMLRDMLILMSLELPNELAAMKTAYEDRDYALIEKITHKIKSGAVYVGTNRMKYACQYVERYWKSGQSVLIDQLYYQAARTIEETLIYIEGWLKKNT